MNKSPLAKDITPVLPVNDNGADKNNYNSAREQVHRDYNIKFRSTDIQNYDTNGKYIDETNETRNNADVTKDMIEYKYYTTDDKMVLIANNYPVYIGDNIFGFIPFEIISATDAQYTLDCE